MREQDLHLPLGANRRAFIAGATAVAGLATIPIAFPAFAGAISGERNMGTVKTTDGVDIFYKDWGPKDAKPIVFHDGKQNDDILAPIQKVLYGYNFELSTRWVTIHDTDADGMAPFDANALAKAASGTPFKRPENGQFRPGVSFKEFYFTVTGDTNIKTEAGQEYGGFGGIMRLTQKKASADTGRISLILRGDAAHTGFDNLSFLDGNNLLITEDAGDSLHKARNLLDSLYMIDVTADYSGSANPVRVLAQGRDDMAALDGTFLGKEGFQNEGDNEITGIHVSDGAVSVEGLIGTVAPTPFENGWRVFYTRQHGRNITFEIVKAK